jgi:hypothetical protein
MKRTLLLFAAMLFLFPLTANASFTFVQHQVNTACANSTTCAVTVTATGSGNALGLIAFPINNVTISSISGGGTWASPSGCNTYSSSDGTGQACAYSLSSSSGATSITVTFSGASGGGQIEFLEFSFTAASVVLDPGATPANARNSGATQETPVPGPALTLTGTNDVIMQGMAPSTSASAINLGYTGFFNNGYGTAYLLNTTNGSAVSWTVGATAWNVSCALVLAESSGSTHPTPAVRPR